MHELSIVMSILDIAQRETAKAGATVVEEIDLDIGELSTIEMEAFSFAWNQAVRDTILEHAHLNVNRIGGQARCISCCIAYSIHDVFEPCPVCGDHLVEIVAGKELRVRSLLVGDSEPAGAVKA
jgi:hydrogenase nickel incorporation protein HypA/HybF